MDYFTRLDDLDEQAEYWGRVEDNLNNDPLLPHFDGDWRAICPEAAPLEWPAAAALAGYLEGSR